jgi:hypothetical protein
MRETEIVARRRKWTSEEKAALLVEVEAKRGRGLLWHGATEYPARVAEGPSATSSVFAPMRCRSYPTYLPLRRGPQC